jgi:hypothetical protein
MSYEFASLVHPFSAGRSMGASVQNFRPGTVHSTDINGNSLGSFSGSFFAYTLGYGQSIGPIVSVGIVGKVIQSKIDSSNASGYAGDIGVMARPSKNLGFAAVVANMGTKVTFIDKGDPLPSSLRLGGFYSPLHNWVFALQGTHARTGLNSGQSGVEWSPNNFLSIRGGFTTETNRENSSATGVSAGIGLHVAGQQFDYAWAPMGELGDTQYFSMVFQWGGPARLSTEEEPPIIFKEKKGNGDGEMRFKQEKMAPEIRGGGLHP